MLRVLWSGECQLQAAASVDGTSAWVDVAGTSPHSVAPSGSMRYFRTRAANGVEVSPNIVGYVNLSLVAGRSLIGNPLNGTNNSLDTILPLPDTADGTTIFRYKPSVQAYGDSLSFLVGVGWFSTEADPNWLTLNPGEAFWIEPAGPTPLNITFVGEVPQGAQLTPIPAGLSLLASRLPLSRPLGEIGAPGTLNFPAVDADSVLVWDPSTQNYKSSYTYFDDFGWFSDNADDSGPLGPIIAVGRGFVVQKSDAASWTQSLPGVPPPCPTTCATNKSIECGQVWTFDAPTSACTNVTITVASTLSNGVCPVLVTRAWTISNPSGGSTSCTQTVTLVDTVPPMIECPGNITRQSCSNNTPVSFSVVATDACTASVPVICDPPSGSVFALGNTPVLCTATDACGNSSVCQFSVTVSIATPLPTTFRAGLHDNFAGISAAIYRRPCLNAAYPTVTWSTVDVSDGDGFVGASFVGLPMGIVAAQLTIRAAPHGDAPHTDSISLGLNVPCHPPSWAWSRAFSALPGAAGNWTFTSAETTFTFDLGNLPGGGNILAKLAADRFLDVLVQDDTALDWLELKVWTCPPPNSFFGLSHTQVGAGQLASGPGGTLALLNLSSSGQDGVHIAVGPPSIQKFNLVYSQPTADRTVVLASSGYVGGRSQELQRTTVEFTGEEVHYSFDVSPLGATSYTARIMNGRQVVYERAGALSGQLKWKRKKRGFDYQPLPREDFHLGYTIFDNNENIIAEVPSWTTVTSSALVAWDIGDGKTVLGDAMLIIPENPQVVSEGVAELVIRTEGAISELNIVDESLSDGKRIIRTLGAALLEPWGQYLSVAGLGTQGVDGVSIALGIAESFDFKLDAIFGPRGADVAVAGAFVDFEVTYQGTADQSLGSLRVTQLGPSPTNGYQVTANLTPVGSPTHLVRVLNHGVLLASFPGHTGVVARVSTWPNKLGTLGGSTGCIRSCYPDNTTFVINGATFVGNELLVVAETTGRVDYMSAVTFRGAGIGEFTITGMEVIRLGRAPVITQLPDSVAIMEGASATLTAQIESSTPAFYQWGVWCPPSDPNHPDCGCIPQLAWRETCPTCPPPDLAITNVTASCAAGYFLVASNAYGMTTGEVVRVTVLSPVVAPVIIQEPQNITASEGAGGVVFNVAASGSQPLSYHWGVWCPPEDPNYPDCGCTPSLSTSTNASLTITNLTPQCAAGYFVVVSNYAGTVTSVVAALTVATDITPPQLVSALADGTFTTVTLYFDELVDPGTGIDAFNYAIDNGITVESAALGANGRSVILTTSVQAENTLYTVTVSGVADRAPVPNLILPDSMAQFRSFASSCGFVLFEAYEAVTGTAVADLTNHPSFPDSPGQRTYLTSFDTRAVYPSDSHDNYGGRIVGLFVPPASGDWILYLKGADASELWFNPTGPGASGASLLQEDPLGGSPFSAHATVPMPLTAGVPYFIMALYKAGTGSDYCQVAAKLNIDPTEPDSLRPISGSSLAIYADPRCADIIISQQPQAMTVVEGCAAACLTVTATGTNCSTGISSLFYQWQRNGIDIPGANEATYCTDVTLADDGQLFGVRICAPGVTVQSQGVVLHVITDVTRPSIVSAAANCVSNKVTVIFSECLAIATAQDVANYDIAGVNIYSVMLGADRRTVCVFAEPLVAGVDYSLTVFNLQDIAVTPNAMGVGEVQFRCATLPVFVQHPVSQVVTQEGATMSFTVAVNEPAEIHWEFLRAGETNWAPLSTGACSGCTNGLLVVSDITADDLGDYRAMVANAAGSVTSQTGSLKSIFVSIDCPNSITANICGTSIALSYPSPSVSGSFNGCWPPSGWTFPLGVTVVQCSASGVFLSSDSCSFTVTVRQVEPPIVFCPPNQTRFTCDPSTRVFYPSPSGTAGQFGFLGCTPPSGSVFNAGTTPVHCTAVNQCGSRSCSFNVMVVQNPCGIL